MKETKTQRQKWVILDIGLSNWFVRVFPETNLTMPYRYGGWKKRPKPKSPRFWDEQPYGKHFHELSKVRTHYSWDFSSEEMIHNLAGDVPTGRRLMNNYKSVLIGQEDRETFGGILTNADYAVILHHDKHNYIDCKEYTREEYELAVRSLDEKVWAAKRDEYVSKVTSASEKIAEGYKFLIAAALVALIFLAVGYVNMAWGDFALAVCLGALAVFFAFDTRDRRRERTAAEEQLRMHSATPLPFREFPAAQVRNQPTMFELNRLEPKVFEQHVAHIYSKLGYRTRLTKHTDQGVDVIAEKGDDKIAIQCKRYSGSVGNAAVQAVFAGSHLYKCNQTIVITTSSFTPEARRLAQITGTQLIDGAAYQTLVRKATQ